MDSSKLTPLDGLKLGALTVLSWLRLRLGGEIPLALQTPEPEAYADFAVQDLSSAHLNYGFVIDIISLPEKGMWTLQITEPDLGSDPGNPQQQRKPVAGRIIETNVSFLVKEQRVGPMPTANSTTCMPFSFARRKCPNSWDNTTAPKIRINKITVIIFFSYTLLQYIDMCPAPPKESVPRPGWTLLYAAPCKPQ